MRAISDCWEMF